MPEAHRGLAKDGMPHVRPVKQSVFENGEDPDSRTGQQSESSHRQTFGEPYIFRSLYERRRVITIYVL